MLQTQPSSPSIGSAKEIAFQKCLNLHCGATYGVDEVLTACPKCHDLLDVTTTGIELSIHRD